MQLNRDDYCDECWLIVSNENQELKSEGAVSASGGGTITRSEDIKSVKSAKFPGSNASDVTKSTTVSFKTGVGNDEIKFNKGETPFPNNYPTVTAPGSTGSEKSVFFKPVQYFDTTSVKSRSNWSSKITPETASLSLSTILKSESEMLYGAKPCDSDLCLDCLIKEHSQVFDRNLLKNVYGSTEEPHECTMVSVKNRPQGQNIQLCSDSDCPKYKFWKILDSRGDGWKVDTSFHGCFPPPRDFESTSCFTTSDGLCSKEQLVELTQVGLSPRIMDEVRPEIEVSEWFCGHEDSTSRYGFKVSLLDSCQLMKSVYGECKTLVPPESPRWQKVKYAFRDYEPGVRYVLFHHGGHRGSRMAGASVQATLRTSSKPTAIL